jgi:hypothetical protein
MGAQWWLSDHSAIAYLLGLLIQPASGNSFPQPESDYIQKGHVPQGHLFCDT